MISYAIIEVADGLTIAAVDQGQSPEEVAVTQSGVLIDPGPFSTYDEAYDALIELEREQEERRE